MTQSLAARFASDSVNTHLKRGALAIALTMTSLEIGSIGAGLASLVPSLALAGLAVWAARGCPLCWTTGLVETIRRTR